VEDLFTQEECDELIYIQRSNGVIGYREHVSTATPREIISKNPQHLVPFMLARDKVQSRLEDLFGQELNTNVEWSSLNCWHSGSSIAMHHDSNRAYLKQRDFSVTCYLNNSFEHLRDERQAGKSFEDFEGGVFNFRDSQIVGDRINQSVRPKTGLAVFYRSDASNVHGVDSVTRGPRFTFMLWFTLDCTEAEDFRFLELLSTKEMPPPRVMLSQHVITRLNPIPLLSRDPEADTSEYIKKELKELKIDHKKNFIFETESVDVPVSRLLQIQAFCRWKFQRNFTEMKD